MSVRVAKLRVQRFKNLEDAAFELAPVNVLVGANNAGKSAALQAVQFGVSAAQCVPGSERRQTATNSGKYASTVSPAALYYSPVDEVMSLSNGKPLTQREEDGIKITFSLEPAAAPVLAVVDPGAGEPPDEEHETGDGGDVEAGDADVIELPAALGDATQTDDPTNPEPAEAPEDGSDAEVDEAESHEVYINVAKGKNGNLAVRSNADREVWGLISSLDQPFSMYVPGLAGIAPREPYITPAAVRKAAARGHGNAILRNVLWQLHRDATAWSNLHAQLTEIFPGYSVEVVHDPEQDELVYATLRGPSGALPLGLAGTGQLQVIQILAYVNLYAPRLLLLDEPDAHIHPDKQRALLRVICEWAEGNDAKVLIATHSRHLLDALDGDAAFHWMQEGARKDEDDFDRVRVLMDLGALDRSDRLKSGDIHAVVLTEDANAADSSRKKNTNPLRRLLAANGVDLQHVQVWSYAGCTEVRIAKVLSEFIRDTAPGVQILIHRDRDYLSDDEVAAFQDDYTKQSLEVFVTAGTDAESHFLTVPHLCDASGLDEPTMTALVDVATAEVRDESLGTFSREGMRRAKATRRAENKQGEPNPHEISEACKTAFDEAPARYRHGKKTLKALRRLIADQHGAQPDLLAASAHLTDPVLTEFAGRLQATATNENETVAETTER